MFSVAFSSGQLGPLIREFGLSTAAISAADKGNLQAFVQVGIQFYSSLKCLLENYVSV